MRVHAQSQVRPPKAAGATMPQPALATALATATAPVAGPVPAQGMSPPAKAPSFTMPAALSGRTFTREDLSELLERAEGLQTRTRVAAQIDAIESARGEVDRLEKSDMGADALLSSAMEIAGAMGVGRAYVAQALAQLLDEERAAQSRGEFYEEYGVLGDVGSIRDATMTRMVTQLEEMLSSIREDSLSFVIRREGDSVYVRKRIERKDMGFIRRLFTWPKSEEVLYFDFDCYLMEGHNVLIYIKTREGVPLLADFMAWLKKNHPDVRTSIRRCFIDD